ncbi:unnamed protein product [Caenorhabditis angaria]|uniref:L-dopachrome isomerase n=1 Tax=Caenorhabditis angaria TaxID=860376 RepID=A0A9P1MYZ2_9PELO|nr:unnamed protein product [Caenorhabditis angaria]
MPMFILNTTVKLAPHKKLEFLKDLSKTIAKVVDKPEAFTYVNVNLEKDIVFGGTTEPAGFGVLKSIAGLGGEKNNEISKELYPVIQKHTGIPGNRLYLEFHSTEADNIAHDGQTFTHILKNLKL